MFKQLFLVLFIIIFAQNSFSQSEDIPYDSYRDNIVVHTSLTYRDAPFSLKGNFGEVDKLRYKANLNLLHGIGFAYKWFAINLNYKIPSYLRNREKYGETKYFDVGFQFTLKKKLFFRIDFHDYNGYGIKKADAISDDLPLSSANYLLNNEIKSWAIGINTYYLIGTDLNMKAAIGIASRYNANSHGFYIKFTTNLHGVSSPDGLMPYDYIDSEKSVFRAKSITAFDFGAIPGYAYINNINGWQFGIFAGLGGVIQAKSFAYEEKSRSFLGLSPRIDTRMQGGYNIDKWFIMLNGSIDLKAIHFSDLKYNQFYYSLQLTYGYRFDAREKKKKSKK